MFVKSVIDFQVHIDDNELDESTERNKLLKDCLSFYYTSIKISFAQRYTITSKT
jgi:hypothetical protein